MSNLFILLGAFLTVVFLVVGVYQLLYGARATVLQRLNAVTSEGAPALEGGKAGVPLSRGELRKLVGLLGRMLPLGLDRQKIQSQLLKARFFMKAEEYIGAVALCGVFVFVVVYLFSGSPLLGVAAGLLGLKIPGVLIDSRKRKISEAITTQLPEALTIVTNGLRAGFSFPQAMSVVCKEMEGPLPEEFNRVLRENRLGKPMDEALLALSERTDNDDLHLMITALLIQKQVGGNLAEVLDNISHTIRERVRIKGEISTLTAEGRLSALILSLLPLAVAGMILVLNPEYVMSLFTETVGIVLVVLAVIMQVIGIFIIRRIVNVET